MKRLLWRVTIIVFLVKTGKSQFLIGDDGEIIDDSQMQAYEMLSYDDIPANTQNSIEGSIAGSLRSMSDENLETLDRAVNLELQRVLLNHDYNLDLFNFSW